MALNCPLQFLRPSVAAYKMPRMLRIGQTVSRIIEAIRRIIAGSCFATVEMRVVMVKPIDKLLMAVPCVDPILYVDDLSASRDGIMKRGHC